MANGGAFWDIFSRISAVLPVAIETAEVTAGLFRPGQASGVKKAAAVTQTLVNAVGNVQTQAGVPIGDHPDLAAQIQLLIDGAVGIRNIVLARGAETSAISPAPAPGPALSPATGPR